VSNTYVQNGDTIFRQIVGIPMGTNCAPVLCNLYLYGYEAEYVSKIQRTEGTTAAAKFHTTFRLIDDVLSVDNPRWRSAVAEPYENGGIYPEALKLGETTVSPSSAEFIGIHIDAGQERFHLSVYDKRKTFPFKVRRYPRMESLIPRTIPYGVFVGLLHRGHRICSGEQHFVDYAVGVATELLHNGCTLRKLVKSYQSFVIGVTNRYRKVSKIQLIKMFKRQLTGCLPVP
jgi:hypothetical protein